MMGVGGLDLGGSEEHMQKGKSGNKENKACRHIVQWQWPQTKRRQELAT